MKQYQLVSVMLVLALCATAAGLARSSVQAAASGWVAIDDFEAPDPLAQWHLHDAGNETVPRLENPQVTELRTEAGSGNYYLIKKPAAEGVVGNRKALSFRPLPVPVAVGETYTFYTRFNVEYFPNNHVFGLSNLRPQGIEQNDYNALEPSLRVTDKLESNGLKNDGTLMVKRGHGYAKIVNPQTGTEARPLQEDTWYEVWYVVNNARRNQGGQRYDVYLRGGDEFPVQQKVFTGADFRMQRELPLIYFMTNCNTGPAEAPYGNGGLRYDDLYMARGLQLTTPGQ